MVIPLSTPATEGAPLVPYPATLDVPHELVEHVAWLLYEHRRTRNTRWRKLGCFDQALLTLVHLRKNETFSQLGAGFGISQATAWRYVDETLDILAGWAPGLHEAFTGLGEGDHVIVDGTLIPIDRIAADEPYYSQKHRKKRKRGMNVQVIARPDGTPLWFSRATPGRTPYYRHREQPEHYQQFNRDHARLRAPGERAFAQLKSWRLLRRARCSTRRIGTIVQAVHTLLICSYAG
ncbi:transposase family protein [Streptomyces sp. NPDC056361]|uniref:transposase family protein n=1 Tax=Streptomyces sp. NPDC056361 TaxID=3345795 RepID=UPI0035E0BDCA